jgi:hypothetical protein
VNQRDVVRVIVNDSLMWTTAIAGLIRAGSIVSIVYVLCIPFLSETSHAFLISPRKSSAPIEHILHTVSSH